MHFAKPWTCHDPSAFSGAVHRKVLLDAAKRRKLQITNLAPGLYSISDGLRTHVFVEHALDTTTHVARLITGSKQLTRLCLKRAGIATPEGRAFVDNAKDAAWEYANKIGLPVVTKPHRGTAGTGVTSNISTWDHFDIAWGAIPKGRKIIVEKFIAGEDHRLFVVGDHMVCAAIREPASLVGDGHASIQELIQKKNDERASNPYTGAKKMKLTGDMWFRLRRFGMTKDSVLEKGKKYVLHPVANIGAGGESVDVTDRVHPEFAKIAVQACKAVPGMLHGGIDLIAQDISAPPSGQDYAVIETNSVPDIALHHFPSRGQPRDAAGAALDSLFGKG